MAGPSQEREGERGEGRRIFQGRRTGVIALNSPPETYISSPDIMEQETSGLFEGLTA